MTRRPKRQTAPQPLRQAAVLPMARAHSPRRASLRLISSTGTWDGRYMFSVLSRLSFHSM